MASCDSNKQSVSENPIDSTTIEQDVVRETLETESTADYDSILHGIWFTDGNGGIIPNWLEFDSLADLPDYRGLYEVSSDFGFYVNKVLDSLKNSSIKADITTDKIITN